MDTISKIDHYLNEGILLEKESKEDSDKIKRIKSALKTFKQFTKDKSVDPQRMVGALVKDIERIVNKK